MGAGEIGALPADVRALATYSVGTDHIDLGAAAERGLAVFNTPGVLADSVAENAIFLMLADTFCRTAGEWVRVGEIPVGILTALCGGPFFIVLLRRRFGEGTT